MVVSHVLILILRLLLAPAKGSNTTPSICNTDTCKKAAERLLSYMDKSVKPCDDFYKFACGNFLNTAEIPSDKVDNSSFSEVGDSLKAQLKTIVEEPPLPEEPFPFRAIKYLYFLCMDEESLNTQGVGKFMSLLQSAGEWPVLGNWKKDHWNLLETKMFLSQNLLKDDTFFVVTVVQNFQNSTENLITIDQGVLSVPRELLLKGMKDPLVQAYYSYMVDIAVMLGVEKKNAVDQMKECVLFEVELANITVAKEKRRDFARMYNPLTIAELTNQIGWIDWIKYLSSIMPRCAQITNKTVVNIIELDYFKRLQHLIGKYSDEIKSNYMIWSIVNRIVKYLSKKIRDRATLFYSKLVGTTEENIRWKTCLSEVSSEDSLSLALFSAYVKRYSNHNTKREALEMVDRISHEAIRVIKESTWMGEQTRKEALYKVSQMDKDVAYPNELADMEKIEGFYAGLQLDKTAQYFEAATYIRRWRFHHQSARLLCETYNKTDWKNKGLVIQANAAYSFFQNSLQVPAGILQPPFYSSGVPRYLNYGAIGLIMGHEIIHGFDDMGSQFDHQGNLRNWWDEESKLAYLNKTKCVIDQYSSYKDDLTQLHLNGINTQVENVADNGGLKLAYQAYHGVTNQLTEPEPGLPGLQQYTQDQLFMLSAANLWCTKHRPEKLDS